MYLMSKMLKIIMTFYEGVALRLYTIIGPI